MKLLASFSGGKDSVLSIDRAIREHEIVGLITTFKDKESWFHEIDGDFMDKMAEAIGIPIFKIKTRGGSDYTQDFKAELKKIAQQTGAQGIIFGDIDLEPHRQWCESIAEAAEVEAVFPLWNGNRKALVEEFLDKGYQTVIKKVDKKKLGKEWLGKVLTKELVQQIEELGLDASGENGEYHTVVFDGGIFSKPLHYELGEIYEDDWSFIVRLR